MKRDTRLLAQAGVRPQVLVCDSGVEGTCIFVSFKQTHAEKQTAIYRVTTNRQAGVIGLLLLVRSANAVARQLETCPSDIAPAFESIPLALTIQKEAGMTSPSSQDFKPPGRLLKFRACLSSELCIEKG